MQNTEDELIKQMETLTKMPEEAIDLSDIPEIALDQIGEPIIGKFYRPIKKPISIRIDADVLAWFRAQHHYQKLINKACRVYMLQHQKRRAM